MKPEKPWAAGEAHRAELRGEVGSGCLLAPAPARAGFRLLARVP